MSLTYFVTPHTERKKKLVIQARARVTRQRLLLLDLLREGEHLTADELYQRAKGREPHIHLSTVYRNLQLFARRGLIDELQLTGGRTRYFELKRPQKHYHAICLACGRTLDFNNPMVERARQAAEAETGMVITDVQLSMTGYCGKCYKARKNFWAAYC